MAAVGHKEAGLRRAEHLRLHRNVVLLLHGGLVCEAGQLFGCVVHRLVLRGDSREVAGSELPLGLACSLPCKRFSKCSLCRFSKASSNSLMLGGAELNSAFFKGLKHTELPDTTHAFRVGSQDFSPSYASHTPGMVFKCCFSSSLRTWVFSHKIIATTLQTAHFLAMHAWRQCSLEKQEQRFGQLRRAKPCRG